MELHFEVLAVFLDHDLELHTGKEGLDGGDYGKAADHEGGHPVDEAGLEVLGHDGNKEGSGNDREEEGKEAKEPHGVVGPVESGDGAQDSHAVRIGVELGFAALRAVPVFDDHVFDIHVFVDGVDAHFRLDLKALGQDREGLDKAVAESPVAGHDVPDVVVEKNVDAFSDKAVPEIVEGPFVFVKIGGGQAVADDHVHVFTEDEVDHLRGAFRGIGVIPVCHDVALGVDVPEHSADDVALALHVFVADNSPCLAGDLRRPVSGIVVINIDGRIGKSSAKVFAHLADRLFFIVAGDQNRDFIHDSLFPEKSIL